MKQVERMPAVGEVRQEGEEEQQQIFPLSFAAVVKSSKFLEAAAVEERESERLKRVHVEKKAAEDRRREDERKAREDEKLAKVQEKKQEDDARRAGQLAEMAKSLETATLHKKYVKNLHDQVQAQAKETQEYEARIEKIKRGREGEEGKDEGGKRLASSSADETPLAKKQIPNTQNGGT